MAKKVPKPKTFGQALKWMREDRGWSQPELAKVAKLNVHSIRNWEQDRREPPVMAAAALARAFGVSLDTLIPEG